jgi:DNA-directed RNA polymerase omega subunit
MNYIPVEKLIDKADNSIYKLVILASKRALELSEGMPNLVGVDSNFKPIDIALREIAENKVRYKKT